MRNIFLTLLLLLLSLLLPGQSEVMIATDFLIDFKSSYILIHNSENEIFDKKYFDSYSEIPDYCPIKVPENLLPYSITIFVARNSGNLEYYSQLATGFTIWGNTKDTISTIKELMPYNNDKLNLKEEVGITVNNIGKLDDIYSLSNPQFYNTDKINYLGNKSIELEGFTFPNIGNIIYLVNRKDDNYRELVVYPSNSEIYESSMIVDYSNLPLHDNRVTLDISTDYRSFIQIHANGINGDKYNLYSSPRSLETFSELKVDLPVSVDIDDYNVSVILRDFDSTPDKILVKSFGQLVSDLNQVQLPDKIEDISFFYKKVGDKYLIDIDGKKYDRWGLQMQIDGLMEANVNMSWENYRQNNWLMTGDFITNRFEVFLPYLPDEIKIDIFGENGEVNIDKGNWSFTREHGPNYFEVSSFQRK